MYTGQGEYFCWFFPFFLLTKKDFSLAFQNGSNLMMNYDARNQLKEKRKIKL